MKQKMSPWPIAARDSVPSSMKRGAVKLLSDSHQSINGSCINYFPCRPAYAQTVLVYGDNAQQPIAATVMEETGNFTCGKHIDLIF